MQSPFRGILIPKTRDTSTQKRDYGFGHEVNYNG
jgi:hypothetical protein